MQVLRRYFLHFYNDSLYRNSVYLMASTVVMSVFGFVFWTVAARLYSPEEVGVSTTLVSTLGLIAGLSMLGFGSALVRFLPNSAAKNSMVTTSALTVSIASIVTSLFFLLYLYHFQNLGESLEYNIIFAIFFVVVSISMTLNNLLQSVFIAYRRTQFSLYRDFISGVFKVALPFVFFSLSTFSLFVSFGFSVIISLSIGLFFCMRFLGLVPRIDFQRLEFQKVYKFTLANFVAGFMLGLPQMLYPLIINYYFESTLVAYYYMPMMVANLLFVIPLAVTKSLFAESSHETVGIKKNIRKAVQLNFLLLLPAIILAVFFGNSILVTFGRDYALAGASFLFILTLSSVFVFTNYLLTVILNTLHKIRILVFGSLVFAVGTIALCILFISYGLVGVGISWFLGNLIYSLVLGLIFYRKKFLSLS